MTADTKYTTHLVKSEKMIKWEIDRGAAIWFAKKMGLDVERTIKTFDRYKPER